MDNAHGRAFALVLPAGTILGTPDWGRREPGQVFYQPSHPFFRQ
jgi:hypothetical protein